MGLQTQLVIDRDTASRLGITPQMIDDALYNAFGQRQVSTIYTQLNQYHVVLEVPPDFQSKPRDLLDVYIHPPAGAGGGGGNNGTSNLAGGTVVPLRSLVRFEQMNAPLTVNHQGQFPVVTIVFNLAPGASLGEAVKRSTPSRLTSDAPSIQAAFQGTAAGISSVAGERAAADPGGAGNRLHRAGRPLRKLHSPDHDSLHAPLGRRRRAAGADALRRRTSA